LWSTPQKTIRENIAQLKQSLAILFIMNTSYLGELDILASVMLPLDHSVVEKAKNNLIDLLSQDQYYRRT